MTKNWLVTNHFANGMYLHRNGSWTHDKVAAARFTGEEKAANEELKNIEGAKWVWDDSGLEDLIFSLEIARDGVNRVVNAMSILGMPDAVRTLRDSSDRITDTIRLANGLNE